METPETLKRISGVTAHKYASLKAILGADPFYGVWPSSLVFPVLLYAGGAKAREAVAFD